jgi:hypothetical protein
MISLIPEERKREFRNFGLTPMAAPAAYKYFSRYPSGRVQIPIKD